MMNETPLRYVKKGWNQHNVVAHIALITGQSESLVKEILDLQDKFALEILRRGGNYAYPRMGGVYARPSKKVKQQIVIAGEEITPARHPYLKMSYAARAAVALPPEGEPE